jgi:ATP sulfurylase
MGCDYFIVGRDHTGVGDFYETEGNRRLFESLGELGITPVYFDAIGYDQNSGEYATKDGSNKLETITATRFRKAILKGESVPDWFVRKPVQEFLLSELSMGRNIFHGQ